MLLTCEDRQQAGSYMGMFLLNFYIKKELFFDKRCFSLDYGQRPPNKQKHRAGAQNAARALYKRMRGRG